MLRSIHSGNVHDVNLWGLILAPTLWAIHFLLCYAAAGVWCAKHFEASQSVRPLQLGIAALTVLALLGIAACGLRAWQRWGYGEHAQPPHDADTIEDRSRFIGMSTLMLAGLSFVATIYTALPAAFAATCR